MAASKLLFALSGLAIMALAGCTSQSPSTTTVKVADPQADFAALHAAYNDHPFRGGQDTPMHEWLLLKDDRLNLIHWNTDNPADATGILWVGDGFAAKGCIGPGGVSREEIDAGSVHFHKETSANWDQGHMTDPSNPNIQGYWLRHIQVDPAASMMGTPASPVGEVYKLMDSTGNAPACA